MSGIPDNLVSAILRGIRSELVNNGLTAMIHTDLLNVYSEDDAMNHSDGHVLDDRSGQNSQHQAGDENAQRGDGYALLPSCV